MLIGPRLSRPNLLHWESYINIIIIINNNNNNNNVCFSLSMRLRFCALWKCRCSCYSVTRVSKDRKRSLRQQQSLHPTAGRVERTAGKTARVGKTLNPAMKIPQSRISSVDRDTLRFEPALRRKIGSKKKKKKISNTLLCHSLLIIS